MLTPEEALELAKRFKNMTEFDIAIALIKLTSEAERKGMKELSDSFLETA